MTGFYNQLQRVLDDMAAQYRAQSHALILSGHVDTARDQAVRADELSRFSIVLESTYKKFKEL